MRHKKTAAVIIAVISVFVICSSAFAHSGRTDENGGHYDYSTGEYHYHNGGSEKYYAEDSESSEKEEYYGEGYEDGKNADIEEGYLKGYEAGNAAGVNIAPPWCIWVIAALFAAVLILAVYAAKLKGKSHGNK